MVAWDTQNLLRSRLYVGSYQRAFAEVLSVELSEDEAERTGAQGGR